MAVKAKKKSAVRRTETARAFGLLTKAIVKLDKDIGNLGEVTKLREHIAVLGSHVNRLSAEKVILQDQLKRLDPKRCLHSWIYDQDQKTDVCLHCGVTARRWYCQ